MKIIAYKERRSSIDYFSGCLSNQNIEQEEEQKKTREREQNESKCRITDMKYRVMLQ